MLVSSEKTESEWKKKVSQRRLGLIMRQTLRHSKKRERREKREETAESWGLEFVCDGILFDSLELEWGILWEEKEEFDASDFTWRMTMSEFFYVLGSMEKNREFLCPPKSRYPWTSRGQSVEKFLFRFALSLNSITLSLSLCTIYHFPHEH